MKKIGAGRVRIVQAAEELQNVEAGDVLVARLTDPDWEPVMRRVAAIVTDQGGRTAHAAIVSRASLAFPALSVAEMRLRSFTMAMRSR